MFVVGGAAALSRLGYSMECQLLIILAIEAGTQAMDLETLLFYEVHTPEVSQNFVDDAGSLSRPIKAEETSGSVEG